MLNRNYNRTLLEWPFLPSVDIGSLFRLLQMSEFPNFMDRLDIPSLFKGGAEIRYLLVSPSGCCR